jgi:hypothetical protein
VKNSSRQDKRDVLKKIFKLTHRLVIFFSLLLAAIFTLYLAGSKNQFLDGTLTLILNIMSGVSMWHLAFLIFYAAQIAVLTALARTLSYIPHICLFAVSFAASFAFALLSRALILASSG